MRKLKLQVQMTVDGFIGGPNGEMDWMTFNWDEALQRYVQELTEPVDCIVLGRKLAEGFIPHWAAVAADPAAPDQAAGLKFTDTPKIVFSRTLSESPWPNTELATADLTTEISQLKQRAGHDIMAYGGATFVSGLLQAGLVDELHLFINPVAIGRGLPIFQSLNAVQPLTLVQSTAFACGIVVQHYEPRRG
ncbi:dihydrofolate reductase family protein [Hymenobacter chitinivorans]|uniref:Dihydrofolate reductase n=1 Tax=Hymenobacter chitinivorans DSM 11115 TaxID=1121954 RepID=A0A2M9B5P4_9BACT|nr:dihydrofolate reductase family protein [Hymenobacter chitinivorans]PJJ53259.1 dihydrofolate reductase [Hymenobacter chitinivorans DSM 11115]